jgi:hypothetical protein
MESNKFGFFWKLTMLVSTLIKYFLFLTSLICFVIFYQHDQSGELVEKGDYRFILLIIIALLFLIAGLLIKIVEHQSVIAKLNNHPE